MNMQNLMAQAQKMQKEIAKKQKEFETKEFEFDYQNGSVIVKINGKLEILGLKINPVLVDHEDVTTLEEMITEAINEASSTVNEQKENIMPKGLGGLM